LLLISPPDESGRGVAHSPGQAIVSYDASVHTHASVHVVALSQLSVGDAVPRVDGAIAWDFPVAFFGLVCPRFDGLV
jgi:hypothetical protein